MVLVAGLLAISVDVEAQAVERWGTSPPTAATGTALTTTTPTTTPTLITPVTPPAPVTNTCAITADLAAAVDLAAGQGEQTGAAVLDTSTGTVVSAGAAGG